MAYYTNSKTGKTTYVGESTGEFQKRMQTKRIAERGYSPSEEKALSRQGYSSDQINQMEASAKEFVALPLNTQQEVISKGVNRYNAEQQAKYESEIKKQQQEANKQFSFVEASKKARLEEEQRQQAKKQLDIFSQGGSIPYGLNEYAKEERQRQYKTEQEIIKGIDFNSPYYHRVEALSDRESKVSDFNQKLFSSLKINENEKGNWFVEQAKGVARFPLSLPSGAFIIGGRVVFAVDSAFNKEGRQELSSAIGRVPTAIKEMYNPKNADFTANIIATGLMFKGAVAQGRVISSKVLGTDKVNYNIQGVGEKVTIKGQGKFQGQPYQEQTIIKDIRNPSESFSVVKQGKYNILVDRNAQTTTTSVFKGDKLIKQTKAPTTEAYASFEMAKKPSTTIKELLIKEDPFTTRLLYTKGTKANYKINDVSTKTNIFTKQTSTLKGSAQLQQVSSSVVVGKNPVTIIKQKQLVFDANKGSVTAKEVGRIFKTKNIEFVFDKEVQKYSNVYINKFTPEGILEQGRITPPTYSEITRYVQTLKGKATLTTKSNPKNIFVGKYGNARIPFAGQTIILDKPIVEPQKVQVSVKTPKLESPSSLSLIKEPATYSESFKPVAVVDFSQGLKQSNINIEKPRFKPIIDIKQEVKPQNKIETKIEQEINFRPISKVETNIKSQNKVQQRVETKVQQKIETNVLQDIKQEIKQTKIPKVRNIFAPKIKKQIPIVPKPKLGSMNLKQTKEAGFDVLVRRKGIFEKITTNPLSKSQAINYGAFRVSNEASASFKVVPTSQKATGSFSGSSNLFSNFYKSKKEQGVFVQKRSNRIGSFGEKQQITFKGIQAKRMKKGLFGR